MSSSGRERIGANKRASVDRAGFSVGEGFFVAREMGRIDAALQPNNSNEGKELFRSPPSQQAAPRRRKRRKEIGEEMKQLVTRKKKASSRPHHARFRTSQNNTETASQAIVAPVKTGNAE